jgi:polysaccharide deacetylase family protein (PEP-CTERM system associated)
MTQHGISFDVEDWHQLVEMRLRRPMREPSAGVDTCVARILDICDELGFKATFFVLGLLARSRPKLVRAIADRGHEIASHSLNHQLVYTISSAELLEDLRGSKRMLEDIGGKEVVGFRAPEFSIRRMDSPCFEALVEAGFEYDSSVFPVPSLRYGMPDAPYVPFRVDTREGPVIELPLATTALGLRRIPIAGGSHFRLLPTSFVRWAARRADARNESLVFYFHPYEFSRSWLYPAGGFAPDRTVGKLVALHNFATWRIERSLRAVSQCLRFVPLRDMAGAFSRVQPS